MSPTVSRFSLWVLLAGCYGPKFTENLPCSETMDCPEGQECSGNTCVPEGSPPPAGSVLALSFDDGGGGLVVDHSGFDNHASFGGALSFPAAKYGNGIALTNGQHLTISHSESIDIGGDALTISAWIRPNLPGTDFGIIIEKSRSTVEDYGTPFVQYNLEVNDGVFAAALSDNVTLKQCLYPLGGDPLIIHHVAFTYDGAEMIGYLDGDLVGGTGPNCNDNPLPIVKTDFPMIIGRATNEAERYEGVIDNLRVYNATLSQSEIQNDMNTPVLPQE
jgi:hypothetical protein